MKRAPAVAALVAIMLLGLALRVYHIRNPVLDHPGWRQGDQAAIARNFAQLENNPLRPQVDYDGPPPNYIELELQIVPFVAAQLDRAFGVHVIYGRLLVMLFSLATVLIIYAFAAEAFSPLAGLIGAFLYAVAPGAVYYGRTFTPDSVMIFFATATLWLWWRWMARRRGVDFALACACGALAWLAKPPALIVLAPLVAISIGVRGARAFADWSLYAFVAITFAPLLAYFSYLHGIAEWFWASGITEKHVLPALRSAFTSPHALADALQSTLALLRMLAATILGPVLFGLTALGVFALPRDDRVRVRAWMFGAWLAVLALYTFVVVNVERVDYYLLPWVPFAVLVAAGALDTVWSRLGIVERSATLCVGVALAASVTAYVDMLEIHPYYTWNRAVYAAAVELDHTLQPGALIVMGHLDPSVMYLINRKGWQEDPLLWNVHDMTSAIHKGARYFVVVEVPRLRANHELYHFLQRYRRVPVASGWQVYDTNHFTTARRVKR